jgi:hypothetical protein
MPRRQGQNPELGEVTALAKRIAGGQQASGFWYGGGIEHHREFSPLGRKSLNRRARLITEEEEDGPWLAGRQTTANKLAAIARLPYYSDFAVSVWRLSRTN